MFVASKYKSTLYFRKSFKQVTEVMMRYDVMVPPCEIASEVPLTGKQTNISPGKKEKEIVYFNSKLHCKLTNHYKFQSREHYHTYRNGRRINFYILSAISISVTCFSIERFNFTVVGIMSRMEVNVLSPKILKAQQNASKVLIVMTLIQKPCK